MNIPAFNPEDFLEARLAEIDLYISQGLVEEARCICMEMIDTISDRSNPVYCQVQAKLRELQDDSGTDSTNKNGAKDGEAEGSPEQRLASMLMNCTGLMEAGFFTEAVDELKMLLDTGYKHGEVRAKIGEAYLRQDMPFDALEYLQDALEDLHLSKEYRLDILYQLALTHERTGAVPQAIEALENIVRLEPDFRNAAQRLKDLSETAQKYGRFYYLVRNGLLSEEDLERAREMARKEKKPQENILAEKFSIEKSEIGRSISEYYECPFIEFHELEVGSTPSCIKGVKEHFFRTNSCVPIREQGNILIVLIDDPNDLVKVDNIRRVLKAKDFRFAVGLKEDIDKFIDYFYGKYSVNSPDMDEDVFEQLELIDDEEENFEEDDDAFSEADGVVVQMANKIIEDAFARNASDIHIESLSGKRGTQIRFRIDGDCTPYQTIPYNYKRALVSRVKIMARLDIAEKRLPQDGKIKFRTRTNRNIELRVATLPTAENNEDIVLRILAASDAMPIDKIGLLPHNLERFKDILTMPYGLVLCVGPTGSGKTTTLHSALGYINKPDRKIWTAEDPVEIMQDGLRQVQIKHDIDLTFARVLRAFLRADPDVIMVGETRDAETASIVIESSLTGHLVFSTLHTNSAPETVTRLLGMGMDPFNFGDALLGVLAQRLVKRLCPKCRKEYEPDRKEKELLVHEYGSHPVYPLTYEDLEGIVLYSAKGCEACNRTGYKGRMAIHELLFSDEGLKKLIQQQASVSDIREQAMKGGMMTLKQDGIQKVLLGDTDLMQVRSACIK